MSEFTPGPWKAYKRPEPIGYAAYEIHWSDDGECVAEVVHEEADANLIAAAPDLYEVLNLLYKLHCNGAFQLEDKDYIAITKAAAALAKAEGR